VQLFAPVGRKIEKLISIPAVFSLLYGPPNNNGDDDDNSDRYTTVNYTYVFVVLFTFSIVTFQEFIRHCRCPIRRGTRAGTIYDLHVRCNGASAAVGMSNASVLVCLSTKFYCAAQRQYLEGWTSFVLQQCCYFKLTFHCNDSAAVCADPFAQPPFVSLHSIVRQLVVSRDDAGISASSCYIVANKRTNERTTM